MRRARVEAVCVSGDRLFAMPGRRVDRSGIDKRPVAGRVAVHALGLDGDVQMDRPAHGGEGKAVYAYGQEDADRWAAELGRDLPAGRFGENLRTSGVDLTAALLGERWRVGTTLLEVTHPRIPCATFELFWDLPGLIERFTARGATGAYFRVLEPGHLGAGDPIEVVHRPGHGVTTGRAFRALTTEKQLLPELAPVLHHLPAANRPKVAAMLAARSGVRG